MCVCVWEQIRDLPLLNSANASMDHHLLKGDYRSCASSNDLGILCVVHGTCIPYTKSLADEYRLLHGIDIPAALTKLGRNNPGKTMVGPWILEWTQMLGAAAQLICAAKSSKIKDCVPAWLEERLSSILKRYGPYADSMDLTRFEDMCAKRFWAVDKIFLGTSGIATDPNASGGDLVRFILVACKQFNQQLGSHHVACSALPYQPSYPPQ